MSFIQKTPVKIALIAAIAIGIYTGVHTFNQKDASAEKTLTLLNVSYDPTRELYKQYNKEFIRFWAEKTGQKIEIQQSHGGSGKQARSVIDGLSADVVTLALAYDIDAIATKTQKLPQNWQSRLPHNSAPYTSTIVFLVRKGNPKAIKDWSDLVKPNIKVITPNPKTSGGARWNFLAAWAYAIQTLGSESKATQFVSQLYKNVPVLDSGARGSTTTFVKRGIGDVLITWENEALLTTHELGKNDYEIIYPSLSIVTEPTVTWVDGVTTKKGTTEVAKAYLDHLYSKEGQEIAAQNFYRVQNTEIQAKYQNQFPQINTITLESVGKNWEAVQDKFFNDGKIFDAIYEGK